MNNIETLRKGRNMTRAELGKHLGVHPGTVYQWERELRNPELNYAVRLADFFEVSLDYLLGRAEA